MELIGRIQEVKEINIVNEKFSCQKFILNISVFDRYSGKLLNENYAEMQVNNKVINNLGEFKENDLVVVHFFINGRYVTDKDTGEIKFFQNLTAWKIELKK